MEISDNLELISPFKQYEMLVSEELKCTDPADMSLFGKRIIARLDQEPESVAKRFWMGSTYFIQANFDKLDQTIQAAIDQFEKAAQLDPKDQRIYSNLMGAYQSLDDKEGFRRTMVRAIENDPSPNAEKQAWLAGQMAEKKMYCQSCGAPSPYQYGLQNCPICKKENPAWIVVLPGSNKPQVQEMKDKAARYYAQGLIKDGIEQLQSAAKIDPSDVTIYNNLGVFYMKIADYGAAKKYFKKAVEINPNLEFAAKMTQKMDEKGVDKAHISIPFNYLVEQPELKQDEFSTVMSAVQLAINSKNLSKAAMAILCLRMVLLTLNYGNESVKEAEPYWDQLEVLKKFLPIQYGDEYQKIKKIYEPLYTNMLLGYPKEEEEPETVTEVSTPLAEAKKLAMTDPRLARQALLAIEEQLNAKSWPFGKGKVRTEMVPIWYLFDRQTAIEKMKNIPATDLKLVVKNLNKISPLQPREWERLIEIFTLKFLAQEVWDGIVSEKQTSLFSKELLMGLAPLYLKWAGNLLVLSKDTAQFQEVYNKFEWLMHNGSQLDAAPAFAEIFTKLTKIFERIQLWWVGFSVLELMLQTGVNLNLINLESIASLLTEIPPYLHLFVRSHIAAYQANPESAQKIYLDLKRETRDNQQALAWYLINLVKRGFGKIALDLSGQSGRYSELSQRVHRAWLTVDINTARNSIPVEDFAGDPVGEFLIQEPLEKRVEYLRQLTGYGAQGLPEQLWVVIPKNEVKKNIFGVAVRPKKTFAQETEEYLQTTPLYSTQKTSLTPEEKFTDYLRTAGYGEFRYQTVDPVLQETLIAWGKVYPQELRTQIRILWSNMMPQDFLIQTDWLREVVLERIMTVLSADPDVFCDDVATWFKREWVEKGRRVRINNQDVQFKLPAGLPFVLCVQAAGKLQRYAPELCDKLLVKGLEKFKAEPDSVKLAATIYNSNKSILDFNPPLAFNDSSLNFWQQGVVIGSFPKMEKAFQNRKTKFIGNCDLCNQVLQQGEGTPYTATEFRDLVVKGFEPPESAIAYAIRFGEKREHFLQQWKYNLVAQSQTGWMLCPVCQENAKRFRTQPGDQVQPVEASRAGFCDICNQTITFSEGKSFTANEFRNIVAHGFEPSENVITMGTMFGLSRETVIEDWKKNMVEQSPTGWLLCRDCSKKARLYM